MKLDKWIRGAQIWVGIFEEKTMEMFKGSVVGGWQRRAKGQEEGKSFVLFDYKRLSRL